MDASKLWDASANNPNVSIILMSIAAAQAQDKFVTLHTVTNLQKKRVTVQDISPLPKKMRSGNADGRRRKISGAIILIGSPHKKSLKGVNNSEVSVTPQNGCYFYKTKTKEKEA